MAGQSKKTRNIIIAGILLVATAFFILRPILFNSKSNKVVTSDRSITMEPQFQHEGTLAFRSVDGDTLTVVDIEIADNEQERSQGMMYRTSMPHDRAMLFIMQYEREQSFWMRNTKMSLDIIYVNGDLEIVTIYKHTQPFSDSPIPSFKRAKYVVETSAGFCDKFGIEEGNQIYFERLN